jgi:hypothetical protein
MTLNPRTQLHTQILYLIFLNILSIHTLHWVTLIHVCFSLSFSIFLFSYKKFFCIHNRISQHIETWKWCDCHTFGYVIVQNNSLSLSPVCRISSREMNEEKMMSCWCVGIRIVKLWSTMDLEGHRGFDRRYYLLGIAFLRSLRHSVWKEK